MTVDPLEAKKVEMLAVKRVVTKAVWMVDVLAEL
jgi:hypothetical protein